MTTPNPKLPNDHPANQQVLWSKGCICDDVVAASSPLRTGYDDPRFRDFVCYAAGQEALHPYADPLSSINIHYANRGKSLVGISTIPSLPSHC